MRIENIANEAGDYYYEVTIIGTEEEVNQYATYTKFTADFIEEEYNGDYSITVIGTSANKKDFRATVTKELKEFRKSL